MPKLNEWTERARKCDSLDVPVSFVTYILALFFPHCQFIIHLSISIVFYSGQNCHGWKVYWPL
jgi:hypothetical protein